MTRKATWPASGIYESLTRNPEFPSWIPPPADHAGVIVCNMALKSRLRRVVIRDQSVFITLGGSEEFRGGSPETGLPKGGKVYSLDDFVEGGGFKKYILSS